MTSIPTATEVPAATATATPSGACASAPVSVCAVPAKAVLRMSDNGTPGKQRFTWKWLNGTAAKLDFGAPLSATVYTLCIYDAGVLAGTYSIPPGGTCEGNPCWKETTPGFLYKSKYGNASGISKLLLKEGAGKAKVQVKGKGSNLNLPLPLSGGDVTVQLLNQNGGCWQSVLPAPARGDADTYIDKIPD